MVAGLALVGCGDDGGARGREPPTQPRVLGGQIPAPDKLALFCQTSRELSATLHTPPVDVDRLGELLGAYLTSAPEQVQPQVESVVALFIFRTAQPTLGEDSKAIRSFKAKNCPPES